MAAGILAIGFMLIVASFPVGVKLTGVAAERTIGAVAADEAFAMMRLYGIDSNPNIWGVDPNSRDFCRDYRDVGRQSAGLVEDDFLYPSTAAEFDEKRYCYSGLCRYTDLQTYQHDDREFQITVFVCRVGFERKKYPYRDWGAFEWKTADHPRPVPIMRVDVLPTPDPVLDSVGFVSEIEIDVSMPNEVRNYVVEGAHLVDDRTGTIMVVESHDRDDVTIKLTADVEEDILGSWFWVIPPSVTPDSPGNPRDPATPPETNSGRYPCVGVYQSVLNF